MKTISNYGRNKYNFAFFGLIICMIHLFVIYKYNDEIVKNLLSRPNKDFVNLYDLLRVSIKAAQNGGVEVVSATNLSIETRNKTTRKGALYETIDADVNSYCAMLDTISASFPKIQIISRGDDTDCVERRNSSTPQRLPLNGNQELEEYARIEDVAIWIEPLDAPEEYKSKKYDYVATMVCVTTRGNPVIGIIHNPFSKSTTWAWVGKIKSKDLNLPKYNGPNKQETKQILTSESSDIESVLAEILEDFKVIPQAGFGYKLLSAARGRVDAYLEQETLKKWDICAGNAIMDAVGGKMTMKNGYRINYSPFLDTASYGGLIASLKDHDSFVDKF